MSRLTNDVAQVQFAVSETIGDLTRESLAIVGYAAVLIYVDARLALVCLTSAPLVVYPLVRLGRRVRRTTRRSQEALEHMAHVSAEAFAGHRIVKAFGAEAREGEKFERASERYYKTNMKVTSALSVLPPLMELIGGVAFVAALWYGSQEITAGRLTSGDFVAFIAALFLMYGPAKKLSRVNANLQQAIAATERIFEVLDTHSEVTDRADALPMSGLRSTGSSSATSGSPSPGAEQPTLDGVTFEVPVGQTLALVGRSGAGKTTLTNLLARFYDPTSGAVLFDGRDIRDLTLASLRAHIGMVTQETVLFDDTVAANIAYGKPAATPRADRSGGAGRPRRRVHRRHGRGLRHADRRARPAAVGRPAPAPGDCPRAPADSPILILDEATSSLDAESEMLVQEALATLMQNRTSIVIAHRLSTVRRADRIVVLDAGRVVETGTHDELLAAGGAYAKLYELQLEDEPTEPTA